LGGVNDQESKVDDTNHTVIDVDREMTAIRNTMGEQTINTMHNETDMSLVDHYQSNQKLEHTINRKIKKNTIW
jgi:hypothetical protein